GCRRPAPGPRGSPWSRNRSGRLPRRTRVPAQWTGARHRAPRARNKRRGNFPESAGRGRGSARCRAARGGESAADRSIFAPRVLAGWRVGGRFLEREALAPLFRRPHLAVRADLIEPPVDFEPMAIGIAELDRDLAAGAAPALEFDLHAVRAQPVARAENLFERRHLESHVVQLVLR